MVDVIQDQLMSYNCYIMNAAFWSISRSGSLEKRAERGRGLSHVQSSISYVMLMKFILGSFPLDFHSSQSSSEQYVWRNRV